MAAAEATRFGSASGITISGALEPSSMVTRFRPATWQIRSPMSRLAGEGDLAHPRVAAQGVAEGAARSGQTLHRLCRRARLREQLDQLEGGQRRVGGRLDDAGIAGGERRSHLVAHQVQREVERADADHHPARPRAG